MKRTLIIALAVVSLAHAKPTKSTQPAVVDPSLATSAEAAAPTTVDSNTIAPENLPELTENADNKRNAYGVFFDVNVGTQGVGINVGYEFNRYLKLRFRASRLGYDYDTTWNDVDVSASFNGNSTGLLLDVHPFAGAFHITAGLNFAPISVEAKGSMNNMGDFAGRAYQIGNMWYQVDPETKSGWVEGKYKWRTCQPYLGIGWSSNGDGDRRLYFSFDLGVNFMGKGQFSVDASTGVQQSTDGVRWDAVDSTMLKDAIRDEAKGAFEIADKIVVYPVLQLGLGYRF